MAVNRAPEERNAWIMLMVALVGYPVYVILLLTGLGEPAGGSTALVDRNFAPLMLWVAGGSVLASMILAAILLCFFLSALLSSLAKIAAYREGFPSSW